MASAARRLEHETEELIRFLEAPERAAPGQEEVIEARLDHFGAVADAVERDLAGDPASIRAAQDRFRAATDPVFQRSWFMRRARTWPEGYPGDYLTLEGVYRAEPRSEGVGAHLDRYFLSRTLAVAVRARLRKLSEILARLAAEERGPALWLNLGCGPCRELLPVPASPERRILCVDQDARALAYARDLLSREAPGHRAEMLDQNALRFSNAARNRERHGAFQVIYSAGLFDYLETETLVRLLSGLVGSLAPGGALVATFKDAERYRTHDYHWIARWHFFLQRTEEEFRAILGRAGADPERCTVERDESGVILFFVARAPPGR